ncbi:50S ribosomal subunit protein L17 [Candidatus Zinderia insecticola CARI]|uniref:50S ribosomal protein L17 n=1 Tax=Zinderia insecticola (strain CARI) TaxID=871271 RepID=E0TJ22_ZINIC|nr:50S ribosomal subunit protein L17 [Candidatus Zinderia insecticola CARI]
MKHNHKLSKISKKSSHRILMFRNMINSLIKYETIKTTLVKAKALRRLIEPIITKGKKNTLSNIRYIFNKLRNRINTKKIFKILSPFYNKRNGGYIKILKLGYRKNDNAHIALIKFTDR